MMRTLLVVSVLIAIIIALQVLPEYPVFVTFDGRLYMASWDITTPLIVFATVVPTVGLFIIGRSMEQSEPESPTRQGDLQEQVRQRRQEIDEMLDTVVHGGTVMPTNADSAAGYCDVCGKSRQRNHSFVLTTTEVVTSADYPVDPTCSATRQKSGTSHDIPRYVGYVVPQGIQPDRPLFSQG